MYIILGVLALFILFFLCWGLYRFSLRLILFFFKFLEQFGYELPQIEKRISSNWNGWNLWSYFVVSVFLTILSFGFYNEGIFSLMKGLRGMDEEILDSRNIWKKAESEMGFGAAKTEKYAAKIAYDFLVNKFPIGTDVAPLITYLEKSGFKCRDTGEGLGGWRGANYYCSLSDNHWSPFTQILWKIAIMKEKPNVISNMRILVQNDTL